MTTTISSTSSRSLALRTSQSDRRRGRGPARLHRAARAAAHRSIGIAACSRATSDRRQARDRSRQAPSDRRGTRRLAHLRLQPRRAPDSPPADLDRSPLGRVDLARRWQGIRRHPSDLITRNPLDAALRTLVEQVTLAPWQLSPASFAPLRAHGFDDAALFDVCATASSAGVWIRLEVALVALAS